MADPISATGATRNPTRFGALTMGARQMTGLVTQRSPYRDGLVPYLESKFYGGTRFDTLADGLNREITQRLTDRRAPGSSVYNSNTFPAANGGFGGWKYIQNNQEMVRVLYDGADGNVYDATAGQKSTLYSKSAGAGPARFMGVNTELFLADGVDNKKVLVGSQTYATSTNFNPGTLIAYGATPGTLYMALGGISLPIVATELVGASNPKVLYIFIDQEQIPDQMANLQSAEVTFAGLTTKTWLNGMTLAIGEIPSTTLGVFSVQLNTSEAAYAYTADSGTASTGDGTTGSTAPNFNTTEYDVTQDAGQQWKSYGPAVQNWGLAAPAIAPTIQLENSTRFWTPNTVRNFLYSVIDLNGNIQVAVNYTTGSSGYKTGRTYPVWADLVYGNITVTLDGTILWWNVGTVGTWQGSSNKFTSIPESGSSYNTIAVILDSNQNLQWVYDGGGGMTGTSEPTWATIAGDTTTDGAVTWICLGPGALLASAGISYAFSTHAVDGSVSTASPSVTIQGGILGMKPSEDPAQGPFYFLNGVLTPDAQIDQVWVWRTPIGQSILILEDQLPADRFAPNSEFSYVEYGVPDTSTNGQGALNALIAAPVADANDPPPAGMTAPVYYQRRAWTIYENTVIYSGGPDTVVGNGNTAFPPLNEIPFAAQPVRLLPVLVQNGGLLVLTTDGVKIILGTGTVSNPYYVGDYLELVSVLNYKAVCVFYNTIFCMESNGKVSSLAIQYPFNPQTGYTEVGFPIGDQFVKLTTGGMNTAAFNPATATVSWCANSSFDTGMYVSTPAGLWFRMSLINAPETGMLWSPVRVIEGGSSCMESVETAPGVHNVLIAPASSGSILMRDTTGTVWNDNGQSYPAWDAKGVTLLCGTGQWAEVAHIAAKSRPVGARPVVSALLCEVEPTPERPYAVLNLFGGKSNDPPRHKRSVTAFSDRYVLAQNGVDNCGDCILVKFDYGTQEQGDELWDWSIFASIHDDREEPVQR